LTAAEWPVMQRSRRLPAHDRTALRASDLGRLLPARCAGHRSRGLPPRYYKDWHRFCRWEQGRESVTLFVLACFVRSSGGRRHHRSRQPRALAWRMRPSETTVLPGSHAGRDDIPRMAPERRIGLVPAIRFCMIRLWRRDPRRTCAARSGRQASRSACGRANRSNQ
jgi:hypothetical protein